jgi:hypothetical protein
MIKRSPKVAVTIVVLIIIAIAVLILIAALPSIQLSKIPKAAFSLSPTFVLQSPKNNTAIHGIDNINITLTWETVFGYDYYYTVDDPAILKPNSIGKIPLNFIPLNLTITSQKPLPTHWAGVDKTYQCNIQLQNLTDGQHFVTLYYADYNPIFTGSRDISPGATILFSINNSTPTQ